MPFVLDNPVVCGWFIENQATSYTEAIAERRRDDRAVAPPIWELEFTNVLRTACLRQRMTAEAAQIAGEPLRGAARSGDGSRRRHRHAGLN